ncbi:hypothetical protein [Bifidobacterium longum]|uniref:hypothetical protein n=1 Tax=Bifidobacterium longum TaxID=216816 RepID=UPI001F581DF7|nr:hypothetical protein [Bifidobacterium longum]
MADFTVEATDAGAIAGEESQRDFRPLLSNDFSERTTIMLSNNAVVVYFSRTGENYSVGEIEVGSTAKVAQNDADATAQAVENWIG